MDDSSKRATVYFDADLHQALRLKAAVSSRSISEIVNEAVRRSLAEDAEDLAAFGATRQGTQDELRDPGRFPPQAWKI